MRCKNCGSENDDNLYICQNCGSPLYEEEDLSGGDNNDGTQVFGAVNEFDAFDNPPSDSRNREALRRQREEEEKKKKQTTAIIIVLVVLLLAIIIGTVIAVVHAKNKNEDSTSSSISTSQTSETSSEATTEASTSTTESTTTTTTTTTTTQAAKYTVTLSCEEGGEVEGDATVEKGKTVTVYARPSEGYEFDGWYKNGQKVSDSEKYKFTVMENTQLKAIFVYVGDGGADTMDGNDD